MEEEIFFCMEFECGDVFSSAQRSHAAWIRPEGRAQSHVHVKQNRHLDVLAGIDAA